MKCDTDVLEESGLFMCYIFSMLIQCGNVSGLLSQVVVLTVSCDTQNRRWKHPFTCCSTRYSSVTEPVMWCLLCVSWLRANVADSRVSSWLKICQRDQETQPHSTLKDSWPKTTFFLFFYFSVHLFSVNCISRFKCVRRVHPVFQRESFHYFQLPFISLRLFCTCCLQLCHLMNVQLNLSSTVWRIYIRTIELDWLSFSSV